MKTIKYLFILVSFSALDSCRKFVEIPPSTTQLGTASVFADGASATAAQTGIYTTMFTNSESSQMAQNLGELCDEFTAYDGNTYYINSMTASSGAGPWDNAYNYIYQANAVIEGLQGNNKLPARIAYQLTGEAEFMRSFWFFYMTNLYGDIPLPTTTDYSVNATLPRTAQVTVYQQCIADLQSAESLMNSNYVDATDTTVTTTDRGRPNKWAAAALLARVYLYNKQYAQAETEATKVIGDQSVSGGNSNGLYHLAPLSSVFLNASSEAIWQMDSPGPNFPITPDAGTFYLLSAPSGCSLSPQLVGSFESGDQRAQQWIGTYTTTDVPSVTYYFPTKYTAYQAPDNTDCVMVLRLGEQFLIRAEARVQQGGSKIQEGIADLNKIRERAGLPDYNGSQDAQSVLSAILKERQHELFTEWGHRWLDLIRTKNIDSVMSTPGNVFYYKNKTPGAVWNDNKTLFPIPEGEIQKDNKLTQNPGY